MKTKSEKIEILGWFAIGCLLLMGTSQAKEGIDTSDRPVSGLKRSARDYPTRVIPPCFEGIRDQMLLEVNEAFQKSVSYPIYAKINGIEGSGLVLIHVNYEGLVLRYFISESTGDDTLDLGIMTAVEKMKVRVIDPECRFVETYWLPVIFSLEDDKASNPARKRNTPARFPIQ